MPRGGKKVANQHNPRHESGIVAPGRRISKQKSNGYLNGNADSRPRDDTPPHLSSLELIADNLRGNLTLKGNQNGNVEPVSQGFADSLEDELDAEISGSRILEWNHRRIDVNASKPSSSLDIGVFTVALTVLKSCPMRDTMAILIFLLSLPPTFLQLTNTVFALLTFVPLSGSLLNFSSLSDITASMSLGAPSFTVMLVIDLIGMALWLCLPSPLQSMIVSWAQAMVSSTLGGGYSNKQYGSDSTLWCMGLVTLTYSARYKYGLLRRLHRTSMGKWLPPLEVLLTEDPPQLYFPTGSRWFQYVDNIVAVHLVCQGITRMVRRWAFQARDGQPSPKLQEADAIPGPTIAESSSLDITPLLPADLKARSSTPNLREARDKPLGKKRRKQGIFVRSQQPLWAAFAATKATLMREYDQSRVVKEAMGTKAIDAANLGSAPFALEAGKVWMTLIQSTKFFFDTSGFEVAKFEDELDGLGTIEIDRSKPLYVRINGAAWASAKLHSIGVDDSINAEDAADSTDSNNHAQRWSGEVYGLLPSSSYSVEFVRSEDDVVMHCEIIATTSSHLDEMGTSDLPRSSILLRPSSPTSALTTIRASIASFDAALVNSSAQLRRLRKDGKTAAIALRRDLDVLTDRLTRTTTNDRALNTRHMQHSQHLKQADDAISVMANELLQHAAGIPESDTLAWQSEKAAWDSIRSSLQATREAHFSARQSSIQASTSIRREGLTASQKRERLQHRSAKLLAQRRRLRSSASHSMSEKERHVLASDAKLADRSAIEARYADQIGTLARTIQDQTYRWRMIWHQIQMIETSAAQADIAQTSQHVQSTHAMHSTPDDDSRPLTPEGDLPGTQTFVSPTRFPAFSTPDIHGMRRDASLSRNRGAALAPAIAAPNGAACDGTDTTSGRGRSTSMLSGWSVYEDFDDDVTSEPGKQSVVKARARSGGSATLSAIRTSGMGAGASFGGGMKSSATIPVMLGSHNKRTSWGMAIGGAGERSGSASRSASGGSGSASAGQASPGLRGGSPLAKG